MTRVTFAAVPVFALAMGCVRVLPPAQPPAASVALPSEAPGEGAGRVVLEAGPGRTRVDEIVSINPRWISVIKEVTYQQIGNMLYTYTTYGTERVTDQRLYPRCEAPCTLELPLGAHDLHVQSIDDGRWAYVPIEVTSAPRRYRIGLGHTVSGNDTWRQIAFGLVFLVPGASLLTAGAVDWGGVDSQPSAADHDRVQRDSIGLTALGGALFAAGIVGLMLVRPTAQDTVVQVDPP
jgi:hypothetical protein